MFLLESKLTYRLPQQSKSLNLATMAWILGLILGLEMMIRVLFSIKTTKTRPKR